MPVIFTDVDELIVVLHFQTSIWIGGGIGKLVGIKGYYK